MILTSPVSCVPEVFFYCVSFLLIYCHWCNLTNQIRSMMSLKMMGLTLGPLVRVIFIFSLKNILVLLTTLLVVLTTPLVLFVAWGLEFFDLTGIESIGDVVLLVMFVSRGVESKGGQLIEFFWRPKS